MIWQRSRIPKSEEKHGEEDIVIKAVGLGKKGYINRLIW